MPRVTKKQDNQSVPDYIEKQLLAVEMIAVEDLTVDHTYQREEDPSRVSKMIREWDWNACGHLAVSLRKGRKNSYYAVIDGQQRLSAIRTMGYNEAPCRVYVELTPIMEAELYEKLNNNKKPTYNDLFKSRLMRGDDKARAINTSVESVGYHLDPERKRAGGDTSGSGHFYIQTMQELERMYDYGGVIHIMDVLKFLKACFAGEHLGKQQMILGGISTFLRNYPEANRQEMINKIRREGQLKLVQQALAWQSLQGTTGGPSRAFSEAMLLLYNRNRQDQHRIKSKI